MNKKLALGLLAGGVLLMAMSKKKTTGTLVASKIKPVIINGPIAVKKKI